MIERYGNVPVLGVLPYFDLYGDSTYATYQSHEWLERRQQWWELVRQSLKLSTIYDWLQNNN
jgi:hypothetical protein